MGVDERIILWIPGEPLSKARARGLANGHHYTPKTTRQAQDRIRVEARLALGPPRRRELPIPSLEPLELTIHFFRGSRLKRDIDNLAKLYMDALQGLLWENDVQIHTLHATQEWVKHSPGALLIVQRATPAPRWLHELAEQAGRVA